MDSDTAAFLIQRAWRRYRGCPGRWGASELEEATEEEVAQRTLATSGYMTTSISSCFSDMRTSNSFSDWRVSASNTDDNLGGGAAAVARIAATTTEVETSTQLRGRRLEQLKEADSLSIMSDCSELMGEVGKLLKEQLASQDALLRPRLHHLPGSRSSVFPTAAAAASQAPQQRSLQPPTSSGRPAALPQPPPPQQQQQQHRGRSLGREDATAAMAEDEARREMRKANFLSLAQEFAELKRRNADALPFNLHRLGRENSSGTSPSSSGSPTPPESSASPSAQSPTESSGGAEVSESLYQLVPVPLLTPSQAGAPRSPLRREERLHDLFASGASASGKAAIDISAASAGGAGAAASVADEETVTMRRGGGLSERERVLQALSMSAEDNEEDDSVLASASPVAGGSASASATSASFASSGPSIASAPAGSHRRRRLSAGMEMCFRNDAASDTECSEVTAPTDCGGGGGGGGGDQWQRRQRRAPKNGFVVPKVSQAAAPMQLCFISDLTSDDDDSVSANSSTLVSDSGIGDAFKSETRRQPEPSLLTESQCTTATSTTSSCLTMAPTAPAADGSVASVADAPEDTAGAADGNADLLARQARLQAEAQLALAQARPMAKMQLEVERHEQRNRASRDLVAELIGVSSADARRFHRCHLQQLSVGALQLIHNDLLCRIEEHNEELVRSLIKRDDLHMEQDSMLIEVEDLTRRAQEVASRLQDAPTAQRAPVSTAAAAAAAAKSATSPVRRKMSSLTSRLKPNKLVSLFTGGN